MSTLSLFPDAAVSEARSERAGAPARGTGADAKRRQAALGQFMTPPHVAAFMASWFDAEGGGDATLLDPGAGQGALTSAFLDRWATRGSVAGVAVEVDAAMRHALGPRLAGTGVDVLGEDFVEWGTEQVRRRRRPFSHAILNPPYRKLGNQTRHDRSLRSVGIESPNLYAAFVSLSLELLREGGQLVALVPRSFCNGAYYAPFRKHLLRRASINRLHLFGSRTATFKGDAVLQENVILKLTRGAEQGEVELSLSTDDTLGDLTSRRVPFAEVVPQAAGARFIHIPTEDSCGVERLGGAAHPLAVLGIQVSTGPVVDFRVREHLCDEWQPGAVPLVYPLHFDGLGVVWPRQGAKKPNALRLNETTLKSTYGPGTYCVVRRLSSKEERRRVVACVVSSGALGDAPRLAFENHVNVFHAQRSGLPPLVARGLALYLNSSAFDASFRQFNGHTQVNVGDLKQMVYPTTESLERLGRHGPDGRHPGQEAIDAAVETVLA